MADLTAVCLAMYGVVRAWYLVRALIWGSL